MFGIKVTLCLLLVTCAFVSGLRVTQAFEAKRFLHIEVYTLHLMSLMKANWAIPYHVRDYELCATLKSWTPADVLRLNRRTLPGDLDYILKHYNNNFSLYMSIPGKGEIAQSTRELLERAALKAAKEKKTVNKDNAYVTLVGTKENPGKSCLDIKNRGGTTSQNYYIKLNGRIVRVYCDQTTAGGGWTLVYAFYITKDSNAVSPRASWPLYGETRLSFTTPQSETDFNAMKFQYWADIGNDLMIKSNINNWITCSEGTGSLVAWRSGSLNCNVVKRVTNKCSEVVPNAIMVDYYWSGPNIYDDRVSPALQQVYYSIDTDITGAEKAYFDPCGDALHTYNGSKFPHGSLFIR